MFEKKMIAQVEKGNQKIQVHCDPQCPLGVLHDALMEIKGFVVESMVKAQKEEEDVTKKQKELEVKTEPEAKE